MKATLTQYATKNKHQEHIKWLLENEKAKEIINYYLSNHNRHFLIQNLEPNFTFTKDYVFDNDNKMPVIFFENSFFEILNKNIAKFQKGTTELKKFDDFYI